MLSRKVLVLGAGFSRALSPAMPLTDELGNLCLDDSALRSDPRVPAGGFSGGRFETWLSHLADEQPYLTAEENLENQALFLRFSAAIADKLGDRVNEALAAGWPQWFPEFLRLCHCNRSKLLTFNYDPLIECGVATGMLRDLGGREPVYWAEVIGDVPNWAPGSAGSAAERAVTFRLLKLHGSLNWYWVPDDATGISMARRGLPGVYGKPAPYEEEDRRRELPGRVPFVVPPSATKSPYYRNPIVREIWRQASSALREATDVTLIGYSLPSTDLTFAAMLTDALRGSSAPITIVDLAPVGVRERLAGLGIPNGRIREIPVGSGSAVETFVTSWRDSESHRLPDVLSARHSDELDDPLLVYWNDAAAGVVTQLDRLGDDVVLSTEPRMNVGLATQGRNEADPPLVTLRELLQVADGAHRVTVDSQGGHRQILIAASTWKPRTGAGRGVWTALIPSGFAPDA